MKVESKNASEESIGELELSDIINVVEVQGMMDNFYELVRIPMAIIDLRGKILVGVGWQEICTKFHRVHPESLRNCIESDVHLTEGIPRGEFKLYRCRNGMWDMATPIYVGGQLMGNLFIGQFFFEDEKIDHNHFLSNSSKYGFNQTQYLKVLEIVPRLKREDIENAKLFFIRLADSLSQLGFSNIKLGQALKARDRDIYERKNTEKLLEENRAHLERSQKIAHLGSWELDILNNKLSWSDEVYRIFGLKPREFEATYEAFLEAVHPDDRVLVDNAYSTSLNENKDTYEIEHRIIRRRTGEVRIVHEKCEHFRDKSGRITRSVGMVHDITSRKTAEKELKESKEKLHLALENGNIGLWDWNLNTDEMILDNRMQKMLGIEPGTFGNTYKDFENLLYEEDIPHLKSTIKKAVNENIPFETVFRIRMKNEEDKYINSKAIVGTDGPGVAAKITGVCFDITEMKKGAEQVLFDLNQELLRSNSELQHFAYVVSHDLQEPLRMVASFTQLLSMKYKDKLDKDAEEYIKFIVDGAFRMQNQINDLLTLSRIQTKGREFSKVSMNSVFEQVLKNLKMRIREKNAIITSDDLGSVIGDEGQMVQLIQNLIGNAIKYCTTTPKINITSKEIGKFNLYSIQDNGIGIEPENLERIFQIFRRLHSKDEYEGTGIGLAICKRILERHKGNIWAESKPGTGSTFYFSIPRNREPEYLSHPYGTKWPDK